MDRQRTDCAKLCADRGWDIVEEFSDNDVSASSAKPRPAYQRMLAALRRGEAEVVVAWHVDRLTRKLTELEELIDLAQGTGVRIATVTGDIDLSTDAGRLVGRILASVARGEVERKGARQKRAQQQAAEEGRPAGGRRPFGYERDGVTVNEAEAELVREAFARVLQGASLRGIAADWNTRGSVTSMGKAWIPPSVRHVLRNPRYAGLRTYRGDVVGPAVWPALVDSEAFDAVHAILSMPERRTTTIPAARLYLLPSIARCHCGSTVMTGRTQHGVRTYRCRERRGHLARAAEPIDELVSAVVIERLSRPDAVALLEDRTAPDIGVYRERADAIRHRLDDLATALADGLLTLPAVRRASGELKKELAKAEAQIASLSRADVLAPFVGGVDVRAAWEAADLGAKRAVIETLMTVTILKPLRGRQTFDPATLAIDWKKE